MGSISLSDANKERTSITNEELEQIQKMYKQLVKQVSQQSKDLSTDESASASLKRLQLNDLKKDLNRAIRELGTQLEQNISSDMNKAASAVCDDMNKWHDKIGLKLEGALANVPTQIVQMVSSGKLYEGNWSLSSAIWKDVQKTQGDINSIIAQGIALNKSAYDIAKDLEKYVDPSARKDWDWGKVYPGTKKVVDYNAQRLARTMVSHAYQQSLVSTCAKNPFVEGFIWHSAHSSRVCPICQERDGKTFPKNDLPLDHPNGMCTYEPATDDLTSISNRLADWVKGSPDAELDNWYQDLMKGNVKAAREKNSKALSTSYKKLRDGTAAFNKFDDYYRNIYDGLYDTDPDAYRAIAESYTGGEYLAMNKLLRTGIFDKDLLVQLANEKELRGEIAFAKRAITGIKCPEDIVVYRRVSTLGDLAGNTKGSTYTSKGFLSSTLDPKAYEGYDGEDFKSFGKIEIEIRVQKGYDKGSFIHSISMQDSEYEFLFAPDTEFDVIELGKNKVVLLAK